MKAMTIVVYFADGQKPGDVTFGSVVNGGTVTAMATYDMFETMEIAEEALGESRDDKCVAAMEKIDEYINGLSI